MWERYEQEFNSLDGFQLDPPQQQLWGNAVAQLVEALRYKLEGRGFDSRWCHWNFSLA